MRAGDFRWLSRSLLEDPLAVGCAVGGLFRALLAGSVPAYSPRWRLAMKERDAFVQLRQSVARVLDGRHVPHIDAVDQPPSYTRRVLAA